MSACHVPTPYNGEFAVVLYDRSGIFITDRHYERDGIRYDLAHLGNLSREQGPLHPGVWAGSIIGVVQTLILVGLAVAAGSMSMGAAAAVTLAVPCGVVVLCATRWPRQLRLIARHQGSRVVLLRTRNADEFGQVVRALGRATEIRRRAAS